MKGKRKTKRTRKKERKKERKNSIIPLPPVPPPSLQTLSPLHTTPSFARIFPDLSGRQKVHHRLVALLYGEKLRDLHVPESPRFPACFLSHCFPECLLLVIPSAAVAGEVLPRLGYGPSTPPAFVVVSVAEPLQVDSSGRMPRLQSVEPGSQRFHACHRDRSLRPCLALESEAEVFAGPVGLPMRLRCRPSLGDSSSPVRGRCVWPLYHCASAQVLGQVGLTVCFFVSVDVEVYRDPMDLGCDAVGEETPHPSVDPPRQCLPWAQLQVCLSSNCGL
jgi:hypothetical protein